MQQKLSYQTQHLLSKLLQMIATGVRRIEKSRLYFRQIPRNSKARLIFRSLAHEYITWKEFSQYLNEHNIACSRDECLFLILSLGGKANKLQEIQLENYLKREENPYEDTEIYDQEVRSTFATILYQILHLERSADKLRENIQKRWDYDCILCFQLLARESSIDLKKIHQFFVRMKSNISEADASALLRNFGTEGKITQAQFYGFMSTIKDRVRSDIEQWATIHDTSQGKAAAVRYRLCYMASPSTKLLNKNDLKLAQDYLRPRLHTQHDYMASPKKGSQSPPSRFENASARNHHQSKQNAQAFNTVQVTPKQHIIPQIPVTYPRKEDQDSSRWNQEIVDLFMYFVREVASLNSSTLEAVSRIDHTIVNEISQLSEEIWSQFWEHHHIEVYSLSKQTFFQFMDSFSQLTNAVKPITGDFNTLQKLFTIIHLYHQRFKDQIKLHFFNRKKCSFIQLFQLIDHDDNNFITLQNVLKISKQCASELTDHDIRCFWIMFQSKPQVEFQQFLSTLTPPSI